MKAKRAVITILLVEESERLSNEEIEKEIFESLSKGESTIPWLEQVEKVKVLED